MTAGGLAGRLRRSERETALKAHRRIVLREAAMGAGLLTAAWYLYYLLGVGSLLDYLQEGPLLEYVTGPGIPARR